MPKISNLPQAQQAQLTDLIPAVQGSTTRKETLQQIVNLISGTLVISESQVTGLVADLASKLAIAANLSDVADVPTARTNLGLGTVAVKDASDVTKTIAAMMNGTATIGHFAVFADAAGTIQDGGSVTALGGRLLNIQAILSTGTYTPTLGTKSIIGFVQGAGAGGGGSGTGSPGVGGNGGSTVFGSFATANGGTGGGASNGAGGTGGSPGTGTIALAGSSGGSTATPVNTVGGQGAPGIFGTGSSRGGQVASNGTAGQTNTGAGGSGGGGGAGFAGAAGGGAGSLSIVFATGITGTYSCTLNAGGTAGTAGTGGNVGGAGGLGIIIIFEFT